MVLCVTWPVINVTQTKICHAEITFANVQWIFITIIVKWSVVNKEFFFKLKLNINSSYYLYNIVPQKSFNETCDFNFECVANTKCLNSVCQCEIDGEDLWWNSTGCSEFTSNKCPGPNSFLKSTKNEI